MSIESIFEKVRSNISSNAAFSGFNLFRSESKNNTGAQGKEKVPYVRMIILRDRLDSIAFASKAKLTLSLEIQVVFSPTNRTDKDDVTRISDYSSKQIALYNSVLTRENETLLGLDFLEGVSMRSEPMELKEKTNIGIRAFPEFSYYIDMPSV